MNAFIFFAGFGPCAFNQGSAESAAFIAFLAAGLVLAGAIRKKGYIMIGLGSLLWLIFSFATMGDVQHCGAVSAGVALPLSGIIMAVAYAIFMLNWVDERRSKSIKTKKKKSVSTRKIKSD